MMALNRPAGPPPQMIKFEYKMSSFFLLTELAVKRELSMEVERTRRLDCSNPLRRKHFTGSGRNALVLLRNRWKAYHTNRINNLIGEFVCKYSRKGVSV